MQPEQADEARAWLKKSADDLRGAAIDLAAEPPLIEDALFHAQQAAEKAMKAYLAAHGLVFRRTHDLDELAEQCLTVDPGLAGILDPARELSVYAWHFRYPGDDEAPPADEAGRTVETAKKVHVRMTEVIAILIAPPSSEDQ